MFLKPLGLKVVLIGAAGLGLLLIVSLWELYGHVIERRHRHAVIAEGKEAIALVAKSSGLDSVILNWTDTDGRVRTGEARTRKQVSNGKPLVGARVAIKFVVDPAYEPVILSEVDNREGANLFWIESNLWVTAVIILGCAIIGLQVLRTRAH